MSDLGAHIGTVAVALLGEPNKRLSTARELRFGNNGSVSVDLENGRWFSHEENIGGNVVEMIEKYAGLHNGGVSDWLDAHGFPRQPRETVARKEIEAVYPYEDETGTTLYEAVRFRLLDANGKPLIGANGKPRKTFQQRAPKEGGGWNWSLKGVRLVPYRLPELLEALAQEQLIFIAEGEKKVDTLRALGVAATCGPMGAGKWHESFNALFAGANVIVLPDNDDPGREHAHKIGEALSPVAASVKILELPNLPEKGDIVDWVERGGTRAALDALVARARPWTREPYKSQFGAIPFSNLDQTTFRYEWLIKNLLPRREVIMIYGATMSGKSFLALDLSLAVARGTEVFGYKSRKGGVIYQAGEGGRGIVLRLKAYRIFHKIEDAALPFILLPNRVDLFHSDGHTDRLIAEIKALSADLSDPLELVVVDTVARAMPGADENAGKDMSIVIGNCQRIQEECECTVLLVHHKNAGGARPRGHTSLEAGVETALDVMRDEATGVRTLRVAKQKDGVDGTTHQFRLQPVKIGVDEDGDTVTSCVIVPFETGISQADKRNVKRSGTKLPDQARIALDALRHVLTRHGVEPPLSLRLPFGAKVVHWHIWRERFYSQVEGEEETVRKAFQRAGERLVADKMVQRENPYVWLGPSAAQALSIVPSDVPSDVPNNDDWDVPNNQ